MFFILRFCSSYKAWKWDITALHWGLSTRYHSCKLCGFLLLNWPWLDWTGIWCFLWDTVWQQNVSFHCTTVNFVGETFYTHQDIMTASYSRHSKQTLLCSHGAPAQEGHGLDADSRWGHKCDQRSGIAVLWRRAKRAGFGRPREEKTL